MESSLLSAALVLHLNSSLQRSQCAHCAVHTPALRQWYNPFRLAFIQPFFYRNMVDCILVTTLEQLLRRRVQRLLWIQGDYLGCEDKLVD